jgi:predicted AAA+ superfamily ATPase
MDYLERMASKELENQLEFSSAVVIRGPKWCGKTFLAKHHAKSAIYLQDPDHLNEYQQLASVKPSALLDGAKPKLIDEWQEIPQLWDAIRYQADRESAEGQFILTGSATPNPQNRPKHSGAGRFAFLDMHTMSLAESLESTKSVSLANLANRPKDIDGFSSATIEDIAFYVCRGGWPYAVTRKSKRAALAVAKNYTNVIAEEDISRADGVSRNPTYAKLVMQAYARLSATQANMGTLQKNIKERGSDISKDTVSAYIGAIRNLYVINDVLAWTPSLHAKSRVTNTPARYFTDPSIAAAALGATPERLLMDMSTFGALFETMCIRDLRVYAGALDAKIFHYRDNTGLEADAVMEFPDGRYALFEIKMSSSLIDEGAANLLKLQDKINTSIMGSALFCAVITPYGHAYRRADGVYVVPITCLTA